MRLLASYSLSSPIRASELADERRANVLAIVDDWLISKGASVPLAAEGYFQSKTQRDDTGLYSVFVHEDQGSTLVDYTLLEKSHTGLDFHTQISVLCVDGRCSIYCALSVSSTDDAIVNTYADARCPAVIRDLVAAYDDWTYADTPISVAPSDVKDGDQLAELVSRICDPAKRKMPLVLVSECDGEEAWPGIAEDLSRDLLGAAEVYRIDDAGSRLLSQRISKQHSCYLGAIRLYWPATNASELPRSFVWTEESLLPEDESEDAIYARRFRTKLRNLILSATAVSVSQPTQIKRLREATVSREIRSERMSSAEQLTELQNTIEDLRGRLEASEHRNRVLSHELQQAVAITAIPQVASASNDDEGQQPKKGEVRFYKKTRNGGKADKMAQTSDCGHTSWQASHGADKARKGLTRLLERDDWKSLQHCGTCTGGGLWRVEW